MVKGLSEVVKQRTAKHRLHSSGFHLLKNI